MNTKESENKAIDKKYLVALSFSGEKRDYVRLVADELCNTIDNTKIFYDEYHQSILARIGTDEYLQKIYRDDSAFLVVFISPTYKDKVWCGIEGRAIRERIHTENGQGIIPVRFGNAVTDWFSTSLDTYIDGDNKTPAETASIILERIKIDTGLPFTTITKFSPKKNKYQMWLFFVAVLLFATILYILLKIQNTTNPSPTHTDTPLTPSIETKVDTTPKKVTNKPGNMVIPGLPQAQNSKNIITGGVYFNGNPVAETKVSILGKGQGITNEDGYFSIEIPSPIKELTTLSVTISHPDYKTEPNPAIVYNKSGLQLYFLQKNITNEKDSID